MKKPTFDYSDLEKRIVSVFGARKHFTYVVNEKPETISKILDNGLGIMVDRMLEWADVLGIKDDELRKYFFTMENKE